MTNSICSMHRKCLSNYRHDRNYSTTEAQFQQSSKCDGEESMDWNKRQRPNGHQDGDRTKNLCKSRRSNTHREEEKTINQDISRKLRYHNKNGTSARGDILQRFKGLLVALDSSPGILRGNMERWKVI